MVIAHYKAYPIITCGVYVCVCTSSCGCGVHCVFCRCFAAAGIPWYLRQVASVIFATPPSSTYEEALGHFQKAEEGELQTSTCE